MKQSVKLGIGVMVAALVGSAGVMAEERREAPEGLAGFSGQVRGVVVEVGEKPVIQFKVARVLKVWENNEASDPETLAGRTVPVGPRWVQGDGGHWRPVERHARFLRSLKRGEELTLEIRHAEREHFAILELDEEQRRRAEAGGERREGGREHRDRERGEGREGDREHGDLERGEGRDRDRPMERAEGERDRPREGVERREGERDRPRDNPERRARERGERDGERRAERDGDAELERLRRRVEELERELRRLREER